MAANGSAQSALGCGSFVPPAHWTGVTTPQVPQALARAGRGGLPSGSSGLPVAPGSPRPKLKPKLARSALRPLHHVSAATPRWAADWRAARAARRVSAIARRGGEAGRRATLLTPIYLALQHLMAAPFNPLGLRRCEAPTAEEGRPLLFTALAVRPAPRPAWPAHSTGAAWHGVARSIHHTGSARRPDENETIRDARRAGPPDSGAKFMTSVHDAIQILLEGVFEPQERPLAQAGPQAGRSATPRSSTPQTHAPTWSI